MEEHTPNLDRPPELSGVHHHLPALLRDFKSWLDKRGMGETGLRVPQLIDRFTRDLHGDDPNGRAARSLLLNHLVADTRSIRSAGVPLHRYPDRPNTHGYSVAEELEFRDAACSEPSFVRRHATGVALALAAGCGLKASEIPRVGMQDLTDGDPLGVRVDSVAVPCRLIWADVLRECAELRRREIRSHGIQLSMFGGTDASGDVSLLGRTYRTELVHRTPLAGRLVSFKRLRTTFVVRHLEAGTPAKHIVSATRFGSAAALTRYINLVKQPSDSEVFDSMGGVR